MMKPLTRSQLATAMSANKYIACRLSRGVVVGANCGALAILIKKHKGESMEKPSDVISFYPISFNEYINIKTPFK